MPYINIKLANDISTETKSEIIRKITDVMVNVLDKDPETTFVVIEEISQNNWGVGGVSVHERLKIQGSK